MYKEAKLSLEVIGRCVRIAYPIKKNLKKVQGVRLSSGIVLMEDWHDYYLSLEEIQEIYGGEIVEIEILQEESVPQFHHGNFPKIKNRNALEKSYQKYKDWMSFLASKHLRINYRDWVKTQKKDK